MYTKNLSAQEQKFWGETELEVGGVAERVDALLCAAEGARGEPARALLLSQAARAEAEAADLPDRVLRAFLAESDAHYFGGAENSLLLSQAAAASARAMAIEQSDTQAKLGALSRIVRAASVRGDYTTAFAHARRRQEIAQEIWEETGCALALAEALNALAGIHSNADDDISAAPLLAEALLYAQQGLERGGCGAERARLERIQDIVESNIAIIESESGQREKAAEVFCRVAENHGRRGAPAARIKVLGNLTECCFALGRFEEAEAACGDALDLITATGIRQAESHLRLLQGKLLAQAGRVAEADAAFAAGIALVHSCGDCRFLPMLLAHRARLIREHGNEAEGFTLLREALALSAEMGRPSDQRDICLHLSEAAEMRGDLASALCYQKQHSRLVQSLYAATAERRLAVSLAKLQAEKAEAAMQTAQRETETLRAETETLKDLANRDPLTGIHNRRFLNTFLANALSQAANKNETLGIALLDLDAFKGINDRFSHEMGDFVLRMTARLFGERLRPDDVLARWGGEEFVVVLPGADKEKARLICERLRLSLTEYAWSDVHPDLAVSISSGVVCSSEAALPAELLALADERLYEAKAAGKNCVVG